MERLLRQGSPEASGILQSALDDFARALADVIVQFHRHGWRKVERIAIGGGFRQGRLGEMAIARAQSLLHERGHLVDLLPIRHHPDEAGVVGAAYLVPSWVLTSYDAVLGVDIGGGSIRCGLVEFGHKRDGELRKVAVVESEQWSHRDDGASRTAVIDEVGRLLRVMVAAAKKRGLALAPVVGVGCPGRIEFDGRIDRGTQNLPGDWEGSNFHLATEIMKRVGPIGGSAAAVIVHNDAVVQGLSEWPRMADVRHWGILTIGTGLGNASFENLVAD
jgi:predicted NBD/HSP70 family sugar kinase